MEFRSEVWRAKFGRCIRQCVLWLINNHKNFKNTKTTYLAQPSADELGMALLISGAGWCRSGSAGWLWFKLRVWLAQVWGQAEGEQQARGALLIVMTKSQEGTGNPWGLLSTRLRTGTLLCIIAHTYHWLKKCHMARSKIKGQGSKLCLQWGHGKSIDAGRGKFCTKNSICQKSHDCRGRVGF